jgi:Protein of unknown function with HXXEE motif
MSRFSLDGYRRQWPRIGGVLAMALGGTTALAAGRMSKPQTLSAVNFGALLVHQYEEYQDPGWFPGQFNRGLFKSDSPRNYPLNTNTGMCINTAIAYPVYIAPVMFPKARWLGLAPVLFGMSQAVGHGVIFPRIAGDKYSPGFLGLRVAARPDRRGLPQGRPGRPPADQGRMGRRNRLHRGLRRRRCRRPQLPHAGQEQPPRVHRRADGPPRHRGHGPERRGSIQSACRMSVI